MNWRGWPAALPYVVIGVLVLALKCGADRYTRRDAVNAERIRVQDSTIAQLRKAARKVDSIYVRDTLVKWRTVARAETLFSTLLRSDTVVLTRRESVIVFAADSAIQACRSIVESCERRVAVRDSLLSSLTLSRDLWRSKAQPSLFAQFTSRVQWLGAGVLIGAIIR